MESQTSFVFSAAILQIIILFQVNYVSGNWVDSVEECCMLGNNWAEMGRSCETHSTAGWFLTHITQETCQHAARLCCSEQKKVESCDAGVSEARRGTACLQDARLGINQYATDQRDCCKCCELGLLARSAGAECGLMFLSDQCSNAYTECCIVGISTEAEITLPPPTEHPSMVTEPELELEGAGEEVEEEGGSGMCAMLAGELCDHVCSDTRTGFRCDCYPGYNLADDGTSCMGSTGNGDPCETAGCEHMCETVDHMPRCVCNNGYMLESDQTSCTDINECAMPVTLCGSGQMCVNTAGAYRCTRLFGCGTGYTLNEQNQCTDIDECELNTANCGPHHQCINLQGTFRCIPRRNCGIGFYLDSNFNCEDLNECQSNPCAPGYSCINTPGSFTCRANLRCSAGYEPDEEATTCQDIDECAGGVDECYENQNCVNTLGTYLCQCESGFKTEHEQQRCVDIDECSEYAGRVCAHSCINTIGSFYCECDPGFTMDQDSRNCVDINECERSPCSQHCTNTYGSFRCYCDIGYEVWEDQISCQDVNECELSPEGRPLCQYECVNIEGSYVCRCPTGYDILQDHRSCKDIDECMLGIDFCMEGHQCFNTRGSYECNAVVCPHYFTSTVDRHGRVRCLKNPCDQVDIDCIMDPTGAITNDYISLPSNLRITTPQDLITMSGRVIGDVSQHLRFRIVRGNELGHFMVRQDGHTGTVVMVSGIVGPYTTILDLEMDSLNNVNIVTARSVARIHIYVSQYEF